MTQATDARDAALELVECGTPLSWLIAARAAVNELAATGTPWNSDDVWDRVGQPPEPRALGAVIRAASKAGTIRATGEYTQSRRPECHARPIMGWIGTAPQAGDSPVEDTDATLF
jgi:hypothetical protein